MKKIVSSVPSGGAPVFAQEMLHDVLTKEVWDAIEGIYGSLEFPKYSAVSSNSNQVITGGIFTHTGGGVYSISAGIAYFPTAGGILAKFPAVTGFTPGFLGITYVNLLAPTVEQKTFYDAVDKDLFETYTAEISSTIGTNYVAGFAGTGGGQLFPSLQNILDQIDSKINTMTGRVATYYAALPTWNMDSTAYIDVAISGGTGWPNKGRIVGVDVQIRADSGAAPYRSQHSIKGPADSITFEPAGDWEIIENSGDDGFTVRLYRTTGGYFDSTEFDSTAASRGYIKIEHLPLAGFTYPAL